MPERRRGRPPHPDLLTPAERRLLRPRWLRLLAPVPVGPLVVFGVVAGAGVLAVAALLVVEWLGA